MFLNQVDLIEQTPFPVMIPKPPSSIDVSQMSENQFHIKLKKGYDDHRTGRVVNAQVAFDRFRESHK